MWVQVSFSRFPFLFKTGHTRNGIPDRFTLIGHLIRSVFVSHCRRPEKNRRHSILTMDTDEDTWPCVWVVLQTCTWKIALASCQPQDLLLGVAQSLECGAVRAHTRIIFYICINMILYYGHSFAHRLAKRVKTWLSILKYPMISSIESSSSHTFKKKNYYHLIHVLPSMANILN